MTRKTILIFDQAESAGGSIARAVDLANEMDEFNFIFVTYHPLHELSNAQLATHITAKRVYSFYNYAKKTDHRLFLESKTKNTILRLIGKKIIALADLINEYSVLWQTLFKIWPTKIDLVQANAGVHILPYRLAQRTNASLIYYFRHLDDYSWAEGKMLNRASHCIFVGTNLMKAHLARLKNLPREKCSVVHSPFDVATRLETEPQLDREILNRLKQSGKKVIVCNSRLGVTKGQHIVIDALKQLSPSWPELVLVFVGSASATAEGVQYLERLKKTVADYQLEDRVIFLSHRHDPLHILLYADIAVQAPTYFEALAGSLVESLQLGIPTVSADMGGSNEVLIDGSTGFLFPPGDHAALAEIIDRVLREPKLVEPIIEQGKAYALQKWSPQNISAQMRTIYSAAVSAK